MPREKQEVTVSLGDGAAVVRRTGRSQPVVANILGQETDARGEIVRVWLDRLVHGPMESNFVGWTVGGAVVTELTRVLPKQA